MKETLKSSRGVYEYGNQPSQVSIPFEYPRIALLTVMGKFNEEIIPP